MVPTQLTDKTFEQEKAEFSEIIQRIIANKDPDKVDIEKAQKMIRNNPHIWEVNMGYVGNVWMQFLGKLFPNKGSRLIYEAEVLSIKDRLGYFSSSQIEKLIIDQILLCWLGLNHVEHKVFSMVGTNHGMREGEYWQNVLDYYQKRYLRAIETLARVRKLSKAIALQVNIATDGGQQVNINEGAGK